MTFETPADRDVTPRYVPWSEEIALAVIRSLSVSRGPLLPVLHAVQNTFGYVDEKVVTLVAHELNLSRADVYGVLTFYSHLRTSPPGRVRVELCRGEACQSVGGRALADHAARSLHVDFGETAADGSVTLDEVFCLGNCALGPTARVNGRLYGRVCADRLDGLIRDCAPSEGAA